MVRKQSIALLTLFSTALLGGISSVKAETVLLDFSSAMCGPCQQMRPVVRQLAADGYKVRDVDIQREPQLAAQYRVNQVPTFIVLVDGRETQRLVGATSYARLQQMLGAPPTTNHVAPIAQNATPVGQDNGISTFQDGRIVEIQSPTTNHRPAPSAVANPFTNASTRQEAPATGSPQKHRAIIEATVKLTVEDAQGKSAGTGTIVDARKGEALVLTCGHIFRSSAGKGPITVTLFQVNGNEVHAGSSYTGQLIEYDLERDLGLVSFRPSTAVKPAPIAVSSAPIAPGTVITSVGCSGGANPTAQESRVTANDRYQGPGNIEIAGAPVEGRSGGGLFNISGELVGVCFAANPEENEGLYASLQSIHTKFDSLGLSMVYQKPAAEVPVAVAQPTEPPRTPDPSFAVRGQETALPPTQPANLNPVEQATFEEIQRRGADSEVICIIRPHSPDGKSEVITLNNASPEFVEQLINQSAPQRQPTSAAAVGRLLR